MGNSGRLCPRKLLGDKKLCMGPVHSHEVRTSKQLPQRTVCHRRSAVLRDINHKSGHVVMAVPRTLSCTRGCTVTYKVILSSGSESALYQARECVDMIRRFHVFFIHSEF